jgi:hypothetical protein
VLYNTWSTKKSTKFLNTCNSETTTTTTTAAAAAAATTTTTTAAAATMMTLIIAGYCKLRKFHNRNCLHVPAVVYGHSFQLHVLHSR